MTTIRNRSVRERLGRSSRQRDRHVRPRLERLEDRTVPSAGMVKDLSALPAGPEVVLMANVNGELFFNASDAVHGNELWRTNGTAAGTTLVKDITAGPGDTYFPGFDAVANNKLFFSASDPVNGSQLWESDGTAAGTVMVQPTPGQGLNAFNLTAVGNEVFFLTRSTDGSYSLWRTDGTSGGTIDLADGLKQASNLTAINNALYFSTSASQGAELWKSDGTAGGTTLLANLNSAPYDEPNDFTNVNGTLFFAADSGSQGRALWRSDGTWAGTSVVKDIDPHFMTAVGNTLFLTAWDGIHPSPQLWKSDGTAAGTQLVQDLSGPVQYSNIGALTAVGSTLFFAENDGIHGTQLWKSDGTAAGTVMVTDLYEAQGGVTPTLTAAIGGALYFTGYDGANGSEALFNSDGTAAGTQLLRDVDASRLTPVGHALFYVVGGNAFGSVPTAVWKSYGTPSTTGPFATINPDTQSALIYPGLDNFPVAGNKVLFFANDGSNDNFTLMASDGTATGTAPLANINTDLLTTAMVGPWLYLSAFDPTGTYNVLYRTDGTAAGTTLVSDNGGAGFYYITNMVNVNGTLYFTVNNFDGTEVWKSDGTAAGTMEVANIDAGQGSYPLALTSAGNTVYVEVQDFSSFQFELWAIDGTSGNATLVSNFYTSELAAVGNTLYFNADDGVDGPQLWKTDGTRQGTTMVTDVNPGGFFDPHNLTANGGILYFSANDGINGYELWRSDGTAAGTYMLKDINPGPGSSYPLSLTSSAGLLYFVADDGTDGFQVWRSDGTAAGTLMLTNITSSQGPDVAFDFTDLDGTTFFVAQDSAHGYELWSTDGTVAGTHLALDINPGPADSNPDFLTSVGHVLFFVADDGSHGVQLWRAALPQASLSGPTDGHPGQRRTFQLSATEPTFSNPTATYTFTVNWGDGSTDSITGHSGTIDSHIYTAPGTYTVTLTATDAQGFVGRAVSQVIYIGTSGAAATGGAAGNAIVLTQDASAATMPLHNVATTRTVPFSVGAVSATENRTDRTPLSGAVRNGVGLSALDVLFANWISSPLNDGQVLASSAGAPALPAVGASRPAARKDATVTHMRARSVLTAGLGGDWLSGRAEGD